MYYLKKKTIDIFKSIINACVIIVYEIINEEIADKLIPFQKNYIKFNIDLDYINITNIKYKSVINNNWQIIYDKIIIKFLSHPSFKYRQIYKIDKSIQFNLII